MPVELKLDPNPCIAGWGPCEGAYGFAHDCKKPGGHDGMHVCHMCGARTKDGPHLYDGDQR